MADRTPAEMIRKAVDRLTEQGRLTNEYAHAMIACADAWDREQQREQHTAYAVLVEHTDAGWWKLTALFSTEVAARTWQPKNRNTQDEDIKFTRAASSGNPYVGARIPRWFAEGLIELLDSAIAEHETLQVLEVDLAHAEAEHAKLLEQIEEMKVVPTVQHRLAQSKELLNAKDRMVQVEAENAELRERLADYEADAARVREDRCPSDEHHCACVVHLRRELRLAQERMAAEQPDRPEHDAPDER